MLTSFFQVHNDSKIRAESNQKPSTFTEIQYNDACFEKSIDDILPLQKSSLCRTAIDRIVSNCLLKC